MFTVPFSISRPRLSPFIPSRRLLGSSCLCLFPLHLCSSSCGLVAFLLSFAPMCVGASLLIRRGAKLLMLDCTLRETTKKEKKRGRVLRFQKKAFRVTRSVFLPLLFSPSLLILFCVLNGREVDSSPRSLKGRKNYTGQRNTRIVRSAICMRNHCAVCVNINQPALFLRLDFFLKN